MSKSYNTLTSECWQEIIKDRVFVRASNMGGIVEILLATSTKTSLGVSGGVTVARYRSTWPVNTLSKDELVVTNPADDSITLYKELCREWAECFPQFLNPEAVVAVVGKVIHADHQVSPARFDFMSHYARMSILLQKALTIGKADMFFCGNDGLDALRDRFEAFVRAQFQCWHRVGINCLFG